MTDHDAIFVMSFVLVELLALAEASWAEVDAISWSAYGICALEPN